VADKADHLIDVLLEDVREDGEVCSADNGCTGCGPCDKCDEEAGVD
jgi:hypothetical protein